MTRFFLVEKFIAVPESFIARFVDMEMQTIGARKFVRLVLCLRFFRSAVSVSALTPSYPIFVCPVPGFDRDSTERYEDQWEYMNRDCLSPQGSTEA
ncbi:hypothetical protein [Agrobacterium tumefaciens]|uniref:hypothetical protein n=1 Tax=Agrobacterium tumefaciens TaxID=358 RepID=UPI000FA79343|nr:hypothetical protein [Agrobacterium tumefaciens]NSX90629.1 hypothetical protein [Agrobacterium tumefaciens]